MITAACFYLNDTIFLKQEEKIVKIQVADIDYLQAKDEHTCIFSGGAGYLIPAALHVLLRRLGRRGLVRVHRMYAVNMHHLDSFDEDIVVVGGREIPLGGNYKADFFSRFEFL